MLPIRPTNRSIRPRLRRWRLLGLLVATVSAPLTQADDSIEVVDSIGVVGQHTSLVLDAAGHPVISYHDSSNTALKLVHCNDPNCTGGDESIETVDNTGFVGQYTSLVLDSAGNPVISYYGPIIGDLKLVHCNDPDCAGGDDSIETVDSVGVVGRYTSLVLDGLGNPVISYYGPSNGPSNRDLKLAHCNDANCSGGDESIETVDSAGDVGWDTSLVLDAAGNPVISYYDRTNTALKLVHCNDPNCTGGDDPIETIDNTNAGEFTSLVLDAAGHPVISYHDRTNTALRLVHCNDPNCTGGDDPIETVDTGLVGQYTSLVLDSAGNPVISYYDTSNRALTLVHCNDPNCTGGDDPIEIVDTDLVGQYAYTSLVLDGAGYPVISYYDVSNADLKLAHCDDPNCDPVPPNQAPVALCQDIEAEADGSCEATTSIDNGSFDPDGGSVALSQNPPNPYDLGMTAVTLTVFDAIDASDSCVADVTVVDVTPPSLTCPDSITAECAGPTTAVNFGDPTLGSDNCGFAELLGCTPASGSDFSVGETLVNCTATDSSDNVGECQTSITVVDTTEPTIECPAATTLECTSPQGTPFTPTAATANDLCGAVTVDTPAAADFPLGTTSLNYTATDAGDLMANCQSSVTVVDTTEPAIQCPADVVLECTSPQGTPFTPTAASANDICGAVTVDTPPAGDFPLGTTSLNYSASDAQGLMASCQSSVTVEDTTRPMISSVVATPSILWPPNHKMKNVNLAVAATALTHEITESSISLPILHRGGFLRITQRR